MNDRSETAADARGVRRRRDARQRELHEEHDGTSDRRRRRGRGRGLRARVHRGEMPINANLVERDPDCDLNFVTGAPRRQRIRVAMSNSFGFGGSNSCVVCAIPRRSTASRRGALIAEPAHDARRAHRRHRCGRGLRSGHDARRRFSTRCARAARRSRRSRNGTRRDGRVASRPRSPDFNPRALVDDRKLHKLIRRTDLLGLYAAGRAIERAGISRIAARSTGRRRRSTATAPASTSARAAATTRTSTTISRCSPRRRASCRRSGASSPTTSTRCGCCARFPTTCSDTSASSTG